MTEKVLYNDFGKWIRQRFPDFRVQKISIDAGFSCPNRDGKISVGGCSFCDNRTFNPSYCNPQKTIAQQLKEGKGFFARKYPNMKYIAYFQAYTNTYAPLDKLKRMYEEALSIEDITGIAIGTRPDCVSAELLNYLETLNRHTFVTIEYGVESANDITLKRINRGHDFECSRRAIEETAARGITVGAHIIIGLPGEDQNETIRQASVINSLPINVLKTHQLQIVRGTRFAEEYHSSPFHVYSVEEYIRLIGEYIQHLRPEIVLERFVSQSPSGMIIAPHWGLKNHEFTNLLVNYLKKEGIWQGKKCACNS